MCVAAAIGGAALAGSVYSSKKQADAAKDAASAQAESGQQSIDFQRESRDLARADLQPYSLFGTSDLSQGYAGAKSKDNFDASAYLAANPDVAAAANKLFKPKRSGLNGIAFDAVSAATRGSDLENYAWNHYQRNGAREGREFTYVPEPKGAVSADSPIAQYSRLLDPKEQANYLLNNPMFQAAINQNQTKLKNTYGFGGLRGDLANAITQNYMSTGDQYIGSALNRLLAPIQVGQASAAGQASGALTTGQSVGNTMTDIGNARASGIIGAGNASAQAMSSLLGAGATLGGAALSNPNFKW